MPRATVTVRALLPLLAAMRGAGVDAASLLRELRIDGAIFFDSEARLAHDVVTTLWARAIALSGDPDFALRALSLVDLGFLGTRADASEYLLIQLVTASATVGDGLTRLAQSYPVLDDGVRLEPAHEDGRIRLRYLPIVDAELPRAFVAFQLGIWSRTFSACAASEVTSFHVDLRGPRPEKAAEYARLLCAEVTFEAPEDAISIAASDASIAMRGADAASCEATERRIEATLVQANPAHALSRAVRTMVAERLSGGNPSLEAIASELKISARTLARRLEAIGTSHRAIMDEVRAELAQRWLRAESARVEDVSKRLGFSDASAFHRAFKRWFGVAPSDFARANANVNANVNVNANAKTTKA